MKILLQVIILFFGVSLNAFAQKGTIRGTVTDAANGEPLFGVNAVIAGTTTGAVTDFDGKFQINVEPGTYTLQISFVTYQKITIEGVEVKEGGVNIIDNISMKEDVAQLGEVVVTAKAIRTTEAALLTVKRKSTNLMDGISSASFRKIGDSDAGEAVKRVTGVSVEGGKYVYVRGLGDRYTKTMLNGVDIPGLDPDRNSLQIDIFPTNLIDNMVVLKSAVAEMPADFTGGVVNIETKDFPEEKILDVSLGVSFNPSMHFNDNYLDYEGSSTDWLGFDNGSRDLPNPDLARSIGQEYPAPTSPDFSNEEVFDYNNSFDQTLGASQATSFMDYNFGLTSGNQFVLPNDYKIGYIFSGSYKSTTTFYDDIIYGEYQKPGGSEERTELITANVQTGQQASKNILLGGLAGLALKTPNSKYRFTAMHLQNGESTAAQFAINDDPEDLAQGKSGFGATSDNIAYSERSLTNYLLNGEHHSSDNAWTIDWKVSPTFSNIQDPDFRKAAFSLDQGEPTLAAGQAGLPYRIWRYLDEINVVGKVDVTHSFELFNDNSKLKFGGSYVYKERDFEILGYTLQFFGGQPDWSGDPNEILADENLYPNDGNGFLNTINTKPNSNAYNSTVDNIAGYTSFEFNPISTLKVVAGLRAENYVQRHTGRDTNFAQGNVEEGKNLEDEKVLDNLNLFPSLNTILNLTERQNLRFSYFKTIARPSFKELSFAQIIDPISNRIFNGGLFVYEGEWDGNLRSTLVDNIDLRWELFLDRDELISASVFYKGFSDPIELVRIRTQLTSNEYQVRNLGDSRAYGAEIEFRKSLGFISPGLENFSVNGNYTYTKSLLQMSETEYQSRLDYEKPGENIDETRPMAGQAPYVINAGIIYDDIDKSFDAGIFYNVQGPTLVVVGGSLFPDVYTEPFHSVNFNLNKRFGANEQFSLNVSVNNILGDVREEFYKAYESSDQYFNRRDPGTSFGVGFGYSF
ncbi:TonB-dependent receptor [Marivirga atlantica]|jgi:outer membrane receptor protein involved in Fe transport|uniref:Carboxypeptidase-like regulatory domain-containing protein n=1 Tax=Marivirga atlantica TaxID=1548457 RepID=A0A937DHP2_9BACT|nr:TonB-dependent receptor [Marivirga atlantica]MBL0764210.1 carboxypeptidase-like regulatory domain-containing protein [Marivirga atlantica]